MILVLLCMLRGMDKFPAFLVLGFLGRHLSRSSSISLLSSILKLLTALHEDDRFKLGNSPTPSAPNFLVSITLPLKYSLSSNLLAPKLADIRPEAASISLVPRLAFARGSLPLYCDASEIPGSFTATEPHENRCIRTADALAFPFWQGPTDRSRHPGRIATIRPSALISASTVSGLEVDGGGEISSVPSSVASRFGISTRPSSLTGARRLCRGSSVWVDASENLTAWSGVGSLL